VSFEFLVVSSTGNVTSPPSKAWLGTLAGGAWPSSDYRQEAGEYDSILMWPPKSESRGLKSAAAKIVYQR
jgi:hypothetical protein